MKEGPQVVVIPEQRILICTGCKFYLDKMIRSGHTPVYESSCSRLDIFGNDIHELKDPYLDGYFRVDKKRGYPITPNCCPLKKSTLREDIINDILG